jgi:acetoin utilization protein AcuB
MAMFAYELISPVIPVLNPMDSVAKALQLLNEYHISQLPLVVDGEYLGLIREEEILDWDNPDLQLDTFPNGRFRPAVQEHAHFYEALKLAADFKLSVVPVINQELKFLGVIPQQNLLGAVASMNAVKESGGIILLEMEMKDYAVSEIARITEANEVTILGINTVHDPVSGKLLVLVKTNRQGLQSLTGTFERFNYTVKWVFGEQEQEEELRKNYDLFMNYISM